jgi:hypothetical protein
VLIVIFHFAIQDALRNRFMHAFPPRTKAILQAVFVTDWNPPQAMPF